MALDMKRMERLGLKDILENQYSDEHTFQIAMAAKLRQLTFQYLRGDLIGVVEDGPQVKELRTNLNASGTMDKFVRSQSPNGAWATYLELTLLAELVGANFAVKMSGGRENSTMLTAAPREDKPTITLDNEHNTHWSAQIDGTKKSTRGDGNCGYNAFALSLASLAPQKPTFSPPEIRKQATVSPVSSASSSAAAASFSSAAQTIRQEEALRLKATIQESQKAEEQFESTMQRIKQESPEQFDNIQKQIHEDYLFALTLAVNDLPDEEGITSAPVGQLSKLSTDVKYIRAIAQELKGDSSSANNEEYSPPTPR